MEKIKDILSPGHKQDDETLYETPQSRSANAGKLSGEGSHFGQTKDLSHSNQGSAVSSELAGDSYGATHSATAASAAPRTSQSTTAASNPVAGQDTAVAGQALNPHGAKYDEPRDGTREPASVAATTLPDRTAGTTRAEDSSAALVGGVSHSSGRDFGGTGTERSPANLMPGAYVDDDDDATVASVRSGVIGETPHAKQLSESDIPHHPDVGTGSDSGVGTGAAAPGAGTATVLGSSTDRAFPLSGGTTANTTDTRDYRTSAGEGHVPHAGTTGTTTGTHEPHDGRRGLAEAAAATAIAGHEHGGRGHTYDGPNMDTTGTGPTFTSGPHATETGNRLDPNVGGGFGSSGQTSSVSPSLAAAGAAHAPTSYADQRAEPRATGGPSIASSGTEPSSVKGSQHQEHHYGRDAAVAGAGAAAAGGLYEARRKGSTDTDPATLTHGPHKSNLANIADPRVLPDTDKMKGHQAQSTETDPASKTTGPHQSNIANVIDPRNLPQPEKMKQHTTAGPHTSDTLNRVDPRVDSDLSKQADQHQHHYGRDAAVAGGVGAGAAGAYAATKHHGEDSQPTTQHVSSQASGSPVTPSTPSRSASTKGGWFAGPTGSAVQKNTVDPATSTQAAGSTGYGGAPGNHQDQQHHYGRDAAIAGGTGLAAAGAAHEYQKHEANRTAPGHYDGTTAGSATHPATQPSTSTGQTSQPLASTAQTTQTAQPTTQHHHGAAAGLTGAGVAGTGAAYEYQTHEATKAARENPYGTPSSATGPASNNTKHVAEPEHPASSSDPKEKHHYGRDAAAAGAVGAAGAGAAHEHSKHEAEKAEKEHLKEEKQHQKELEKEEKKHQKEVEKEEKKQQKELEKEQKQHEKELEKEAKHEEKKKHGGILGFLHRDKDKTEESAADPKTSTDKHHHAEETAAAVGATGAGAAAYEHEHDKHKHNKLHKDPPANYVQAHGGEHYGTDGRIGQAGAGPGLQGAAPGQYGGAQAGENEGIVIEPHTGLPMNVGKYGVGAGGTDGNKNIAGFHSHGAGTGTSGPNVGASGGAQGGETGTDWQAIKKANTPY